MRDTAVVILRFRENGQIVQRDVRVPLDISANQLVAALNAAYPLEIDVEDYRNCYLRCERPITLLRGERSLGSFGVRNGTLIHGENRGGRP